MVTTVQSKDYCGSIGKPLSVVTVMPACTSQYVCIMYAMTIRLLFSLMQTIVEKDNLVRGSRYKLLDPEMRLAIRGSLNQIIPYT